MKHKRNEIYSAKLTNQLKDRKYKVENYYDMDGNIIRTDIEMKDCNFRVKGDYLTFKSRTHSRKKQHARSHYYKKQDKK